MSKIEEKYNLVELIDIITRVVGDMEVQFLKELEESNLTAKQLYYLEMIDKMKNPTLTEIADMLDLSKPSVTAVVEKFEKNKYITRIKSDDDRRVSHVHVSEKGKGILKSHDLVHHNIAEIFKKSLSREDLNLLVNILNKVAGKIK